MNPITSLPPSAFGGMTSLAQLYWLCSVPLIETDSHRDMACPITNVSTAAFDGAAFSQLFVIA